MRRTNKKVMRKADDKKGVILVTIIFIVAMALLFITTALTISIASRQRVYSNAKSDQARLTVTSLAQTIWQSIYSQQINDAQLISLAKTGSMVRFTNDNVPGMVSGSAAESTAYFYVLENDSDGEPSKIGIECKCNIDGEVQYYRLVLLKNVGEGVPSPMFNLTVDIGNGGMLNSCNFGIVGSNTNGRHEQTRFDAPDNVIFIHGDTSSDQDGSGFYTTALFDGIVYLRDAVFSHDAYFVGQNAGLDFQGTNQFDGADDGSEADLYFWGTDIPFRRNGAVMDATSGDSGSTRMGGIHNVYFDMRDMGASATPRYVGFENNTTNYSSAMGVSGQLYYEPGSMDHSSGTFGGHRTAGSVGVEYCSGIDSYLTVNPDETDTTGEVVDLFVTPYYSTATEFNSTSATLSAGAYKVSSATTVNRLITCNVSGGDIYIFLDANLTLKRPDGGPGGFQITGSGEHNVYIILRSNNAKLIIYGGNGGSASNWCGLYDSRCFTGSPTDGSKINQTQVPRFYVLSAYAGGEQIQFGDSGGGEYTVLSAMVGLFPSTQGGANGGTVRVVNGVTSRVFYGRLACGGLNVIGGGELNVPYCPTIPGDIDMRNEAYRDNSDFSVVPEECGYFTA